MEKQKALAIMAAGLGTRFGGLKQLQSIHAHNYAILDYSIYDAIAAGFNTIVFIVNDATISVFKKRYENVLPKHIKSHYIIQNNNKIKNRIKPLGTGHALLTIKDYITNAFAIINADDFYGRDAFKKMHETLYGFENVKVNCFIGYTINNTLSKHGHVSRGECTLDQQHYLINITEREAISKQDDGKIYYTNSNSRPQELKDDTIVSMNFWGFQRDIFKTTEMLFNLFIEHNKANLTAEFYMPSIVDYTIKNNVFRYKMIPTLSQWFGLTYKEDLAIVSNRINEYIDNGAYPNVLW